MYKYCVFIPCVFEHVKYLMYQIESIKNGTKIPDQIMVYFNKIPNGFIYEKQCEYEDVDFIYDYETQSDDHLIGTARQYAENSYCDIIIYSDADDASHNQRIEIISYVFEKYDISHLNHGFSYSYNENDCLSEYINSNNIKLWSVGTEPIYYQYGNGLIHSGAFAIKKEILKNIKWGNEMTGEDQIFCRKVSDIGKSIIIDSKIYFYKNYLSSNPLKINSIND